MDRRNFLKLAASLSVGFGVAGLPKPVAAALKQIEPGKVPKIIYLQGQSCTGCSVSLLQTLNPSPVTMITQFSSLAFHADLSAASGSTANKLIDGFFSGDNGEYFLALEGSIPDKMPDACLIGEHTLEDVLKKAEKTMSGAVAVGACAANGGIPSAEGNLTGAISLGQFLKKIGSKKLLINLPGCSIHPDWLWQTVVHLVKVGLPEMAENKPTLFYGHNVHEKCNRYHHFQEQLFAKKIGDDGCLFQIGCNGPNAIGDCPERWWNSKTSWCVNSNGPCIGCTAPDFAKQKRIPFYRVNESSLRELKTDKKKQK